MWAISDTHSMILMSLIHVALPVGSAVYKYGRTSDTSFTENFILQRKEKKYARFIDLFGILLCISCLVI